MCGASLVAATPAVGQAEATVPTGSVAAPRVGGVPVAPIPVPHAPTHGEETPLPESARFRTTNVEPRRAPLSPPRSEIRESETRQSESRTSEARQRSVPVTSGPSILGLSTPGPAVDRHAEDDPLRPSSNLDYLLEDEDEEEPRGGWGKLILIVAALALAVGFGYLNFKQGGFDWLNGGDKKAAAKPAADVAPSAASGGAAGTATPDGGAPVSGGGAVAPAGSAAGPAVSSSPTASPATAPQTPAAAAPVQAAPAQTAPSQTQPSDPNLPAAAPVAAPDKSAASTEAPPAPKADVPAAAVAKPTPARPAPAKPIDPVTNAERYLYGRGVGQDCDHGLRLLKPAAEQSNTKAMITLGALYSTGTCTPRDLPTAYRWFALALHKEPDNQALQDDLQKLWSQMTQPERQLAIKLSQ